MSDILTCQSRKSTGGIFYTHRRLRSVEVSQFPGSGVVQAHFAHMAYWRTELNGAIVVDTGHISAFFFFTALTILNVCCEKGVW